MNEEAMIYFWKSTDGNSVYFNTDPEEAKKDGLFAGVVESQEYYGLFIKYTIHAAGQTLKVVEKNGSVNILEPGDAVSLYIDREQIMSY